MKQFLLPFLFLICSTSSVLAAEVEFPLFVIKGQSAEITVFETHEALPIININGDAIEAKVKGGELIYEFTLSEKAEIAFEVDGVVYEKTIRPIPLWMSLIPPLIAIALALIIREVVSSLFIGLFSGTAIIYLHISPTIGGWLEAFMRMMDTYILGALNDSGHLSIISFSMMIGAMVAVISKNGGMQGVVNHISKYAKSAKSGQLATWFLGIAIFFDDYANTLIVGNTMRPITDKFKISREKLAYIVDSTAAPIAAVAFITTWIGAELGYIENGINKIPDLEVGVYATFINSLAYSFYPVFALGFMLILILKQKDFGPMYNAEVGCRNGVISSGASVASEIDEFTPKAGLNPKAYNAVIPILIVILGTLAGLLYTGWDNLVWSDNSLSFSGKLSQIIGQADSYQALLWSSAAGLISAIKFSVFQRALNLKESIEAALLGFKTMLPAIIILVLAWSLAKVIEDLHTADLLTSLMSDNVSAAWLPSITFILAALVAFSTGSSWGTMAILYPLMLPAAWQVSQISGLDYSDSLSIFYNVVSCVLAGSVLGDHCSPISDTTILSSLASSCDHIQHVRTQMPYALTVGAVGILFGTLPTGFGLAPWVSFLLGFGALYLIVHLFGKRIET